MHAVQRSAVHQPRHRSLLITAARALACLHACRAPGACRHQTDRDLFPWLLVGAHAPFYSSSASHFKQAECMRQAYEPLLLEGRVDAFLSGHVHSYERSRPLADHKVCAPAPRPAAAGCISGMHACVAAAAAAPPHQPRGGAP